jgi:hypothetical protein
MKTVSCVYLRQLGTTCWLGEQPIELTAECEQMADDVLVIWTDETLAKLAALDLDGDELVGCDEVMREAFWASEREECRLANVRQRTGERAA